MRRVVVFLSMLALSLGCGGGDFAKSILGADIQQVMVMKADLLGQKTATASFELGATDRVAVLESVALELEGKGMTVQREADQLTAQQANHTVVVALSDTSEKPSLTVISTIASAP
jgi:hypothetical protein